MKISALIFFNSLIWIHSFASDVLSRHSNIGHFWQFADIHADIDYAKHSCVGDLGNYSCDSPLRLWISALNASRRLSIGDPDFVIFSGDSSSHFDVTEADFLRAMKMVAAALREVFPRSRNIPVIPSLGNHDVYPDNQMSPLADDPERRQWCSRLASDTDLWGDWITLADNEDVHASTFADGCYFSRLVRLQSDTTTKILRVLSLNGLVYSRRNSRAQLNITDPLGQFKWMRDELLETRRDKQKALFLMHFPLGAPANSPVEYRHLFDGYNEELLSIFQEFSDVIAFGVFGHQHVDSFHVVFSADGVPSVPLFYAPSLSPFRFSGLGSFNPRVRTYMFARENPSVLDYHQYLLNLSSGASEPWQLEYSAKSSYSLDPLKPITADGLRDLLVNFRRNTTLWCAYWSHELGGRKHESGPCPSVNSTRHCRHLCSMGHISYRALDACLDSCPPSSTTTPEDKPIISASAVADSWNTLPVIAFIIIGFLAILLGIVLLVNRELWCRKKRSVFTIAIGDGGRDTFYDHQLVAYRPREDNGIVGGGIGLRLGGGDQNNSLSDVKSSIADEHFTVNEAAREADDDDDDDDAYDADEEEGEETVRGIDKVRPGRLRFSQLSLRFGAAGLGRGATRLLGLSDSNGLVSSYEDESYYSVHSSLQKLFQPEGDPQKFDGDGISGAEEALTPVNSRADLREHV